LLDAIAHYKESLKYNNHLPHVYMNTSLAYSRLAIETKDEVLHDIFRDESLNYLDDAISMARNNPFYPAKKAEMLLFYEKYDEDVDGN
jgi:hypothetical protein